VVDDLLLRARSHVEALLGDRKPEWLRFHDFQHATSVAETCQAMGSALNLSDEMIEVLTLAAWFHDVGYLEGIDGHEERSVDQATAFLEQNRYPEEKIAQVAGCIRATKMPQQPRNLLEQVLCDADIAHLARKDYLQISDCVRREIENRMRIRLTRLEWLTMNIDFVAGHRYFTEYAKTHFENQRRLNLATLKRQLNRLKEECEEKPLGKCTRKAPVEQEGGE
jgi:predicted metal-dependent HD superfamily phosphohydrolase